MGANAQTSVPAFTAGQVLTAQQQTEINTGIPVFATTTTRDAAFGGTGEKTLAEGQMAYIENIAGSAAVQYYDGAAWQTLVTGGLTYVTGASFTNSSGVAMPAGTFTSAYLNYIVLFNATASQAMNVYLRFNYSGSPANTNYYGAANTSASAYSTLSEQANQASLFLCGTYTSTYSALQTTITVYDPANANKWGSFSALGQGSTSGGAQYGVTYAGGQRLTAGAIDGLYFLPNVGTITGTYKVYGLANS
jgi:hypothetical protein